MSRILIATVALMISRDAMTILPTTVPAHEVEIQKAIFGEDNVEVREGVKTAPVVVTPETDHERLQAKYGSQALEMAYGVNFKGKISKACIEHKVGDVADEAGLDLGGFNGTGEGTSTTSKPGAAGGAKPLDKMNKTELLAYASANSIDTVTEDMTKGAILEAIAVANRSA